MTRHLRSLWVLLCVCACVDAGRDGKSKDVDTHHPVDTDDTEDTDDTIDTATPDVACRVVVPPPPATRSPRVRFTNLARTTLSGGPGDGLGMMAVGVPDLDGSGYGEVVATFLAGWSDEPCDLVYWPHANVDSTLASIPTKYCGEGTLWPTLSVSVNPNYWPHQGYYVLVPFGNRTRSGLSVRYEPASRSWRAFVGGGIGFAVSLPVPTAPDLQSDITAAFAGFHNPGLPNFFPLGDFNGDGWLDMMIQAHSNALPLPVYSWVETSPTPNGDIYIDRSSEGVALSLGPLNDFRDTRFVYDYALIPDAPDHQGYKNNSASAVVGDFNGDGLDEVIQEWRPDAGLSDPAELARLGNIGGLVYWDGVPPTMPPAVDSLVPPFTGSYDGVAYNEQSRSYAPAWFDVSQNLRLRLSCERDKAYFINVGDLNYDGRDDLVVTAISSNTGGDGEVYLITDLVSGPRQGQNIVDRAAAIFVTDDPQRSVTSVVLTMLDDLDGDGHRELAIFDHGRRTIYVFDGPHVGTRRADEADFWITETPPVYHLDTSADLDGDGKHDLVVGSWSPDAGEVHVITFATLSAAVP